jgi:DnaJ like chaperone protein
MFLFKLVISILGAKIAKAMGEHAGSGFLLGLLFGHFLDLIAYKKFIEWKYKNIYLKKAKVQTEKIFHETFFTLAGKICLADGVISEGEIKKFEEITIDRLKIKKGQVKGLKKIFLGAGNSRIPIQSLGIKLVELLGGDQNSIRNLLLTLKELAIVDGGINSAEFNILYTLGSVLGFPPNELQSILGNVSGSGSTTGDSKANTEQQKVAPDTPLIKNLKVLGCKSSDSDEQIRRKYRELVSKFHPDKVISKDLPQDFIDFAQKRFTEIQLAYEYIRKDRNF